MSKKVSKKPDLTPKQKMFCREYLVDLNGTQAAIRAGYSKKTANEQAARLLANVSVQHVIQGLMDKRSDSIEITAAKVLKRIDAIADFDIGKLYDKNGRLLPVHEMPEEARRVVASIDVFEEFEGVGRERVQIGETKKVKLYDKLKANELLGRHLKLFTDRVDVNMKFSLEDLVSPDEPVDD